MLKRFLCLFISLGMALAFWIPAANADVGSPPFAIDMDYIPKWGEGEYVAGSVSVEGWPYILNSLFVKAFIQVEGSDAWWPKPTDRVSYVPVIDGHFTLTFNTGGDDIHARRIALMLVRGKDALLQDYEQANAAALCVVTIDRMPSGHVSVSRSFRTDYALLEYYSYTEGVNVGFYTQPGTAPGNPLPETHIEAVLRAAAAFTGDVRFYAATGEVAKAYPIARALGLRVAATAWLDGSENDQAELDALITLCNQGFASTAFVGNETLFSGRLTEEELLRDIAYVRSGIRNKAIPVTTADTLDAYLASEKLRNAVDAVSVNIYPYWSGLDLREGSVDDALYDALHGLYELIGEKPVIISETGWPTYGSERAGNEGQGASVSAASRLTMSGYDEPNVIRVYVFSLADEPWKDAEEPGVGAHWGLLDNNLNAKPVMFARYWDSVDMTDHFATELGDEDSYDWYYDHMPNEFCAPMDLFMSK